MNIKTLYEAVDVNGIQRLIVLQENKARISKALFNQVQNILANQSEKKQADTKVIFYRGKNGIQQMVWNELKSKNEVVGYSHYIFESAVGKNFANQVHQEYLQRGIKVREIYSDNFLEGLKSKSFEFPFYLKNDYKGQIESRYIPKHVLNIEHQLDIYNDVVAYYSWIEGEIFGVEIYNQKVASMQKQLFEIIWKQSKIRKDLEKLARK